MKRSAFTSLNAITRSLLAVVLVFTLLACGSQKKVTNANASSAAASGPVLSSNTDIARRLETIVESYGSWEKLRVPVTVELNAPKSVTISGTAFMERGKSIMIMLKYFGFEIGSLYLTNDTVMVIDKVHKSYARENVRKFLGGFDVNISNIQDLLLGRVFVVGKNSLTVGDLAGADTELVSPQQWIMIPKKKSSAIEYGFTFMPADILRALICQTADNPPVTCTYEPAVSTPAGPMSPEVKVTYQKGKTSVDAALQWNLSKAKWNGDVELRIPSVGKDYKVISTDDISKIISKL